MKNISGERGPDFWKVTPQFRVLNLGVTIDPPGATFGPRTSNHYELIWLIEGEATVRFDDKTIFANEGTILFRRAGVRDHYDWSEKRRTVHAYIHFDLDPDRQELVSQPYVSAYRQLNVSDVIRPLFLYLLKLDKSSKTIKGELMLPVLDLMIKSYIWGEVELKPLPTSKLPEPVNRAIELIRIGVAENKVSNLTLKKMAVFSRTSPEHLCRIFKKTLEVGPMEYAKLARLDRVAHQLRETNLSLKEISSSAGFFDPFHMSKSFKKVYGFSPSAYRNSPENEWISQCNPIIRIPYSRFDPKLFSNDIQKIVRSSVKRGNKRKR